MSIGEGVAFILISGIACALDVGSVAAKIRMIAIKTPRPNASVIEMFPPMQIKACRLWQESGTLAHLKTKHGAVGRGGKSVQNEQSFIKETAKKTGKGSSIIRARAP
jgi:hypothetical protein